MLDIAASELLARHASTDCTIGSLAFSFQKLFTRNCGSWVLHTWLMKRYVFSRVPHGCSGRPHQPGVPLRHQPSAAVWQTPHLVRPRTPPPMTPLLSSVNVNRPLPPGSKVTYPPRRCAPFGARY